ncbi:HAMP domain-containing sensor histidine kinase [Deinococcus misasensis]|uniref:HAMP domain-containing sensor histidine kinase n=1 Tax=Deinococcus misasensis TaxID=392413 RepID=UPI00055674F3|nr:HAMP domain-containing sensor histidine kinase [Deinococcus misasensis]
MNLQTRLSLWVGGVLFLALGTLSLLSGIVLYQVRLSDMNQELRDQSQLVMNSAKVYEGSNIPNVVLETLASGSEFVDARIEKNGHIIWESDFRTMPEAITAGFSNLGGWHMYRIRSAEFEVVVGRPLKSLQETLQSYAIISVPLTLLMSLIGALGSGWVLGQNLKPLHNLTTRIQKLDRPEPIPETSRPDEVGMLARALSESLQTLQRTRKTELEFLRVASHELRTPLTALKAELEYTLSKPRDLQVYETALRTLHRNTEHLERLAVNLLTLTRLQGSQVEFQQVDLWEVTGTVIDRMVPLALKKNLSLEFDGAPTTVQGDSIALSRLVENLVFNAIRYTQNGEIHVKVSEHTLTVQDQGQGFPQELIDNHETETVSMEGFGIGMKVVRSICELHQARLHLENTLRGARVVIVFPS